MAAYHHVRPTVVFARTGHKSSEVRSPPRGRQDPSHNIRITTFFAGESEAKIVDRSRLSEVQAVGGEVDFARPLE